jgi:hypothetical protein
MGPGTGTPIRRFDVLSSKLQTGDGGASFIGYREFFLPTPALQLQLAARRGSWGVWSLSLNSNCEPQGQGQGQGHLRCGVLALASVLDPLELVLSAGAAGRPSVTATGGGVERRANDRKTGSKPAPDPSPATAHTPYTDRDIQHAKTKNRSGAAICSVAHAPRAAEFGT